MLLSIADRMCCAMRVLSQIYLPGFVVLGAADLSIAHCFVDHDLPPENVANNAHITPALSRHISSAYRRRCTWYTLPALKGSVCTLQVKQLLGQVSGCLDLSGALVR